MKQLVDDGLDQSLVPSLRSELDAFEGYAASEDILEGLPASEEKCCPRFHGQ